MGIDPGTTAAYALLDTDGALVGSGSSKSLDISSMIREIAKAGIPIACGCDKKSIPEFVEKVATKTGAVLFSPKEDLLVSEKKELAKGYDYGNTHEMDAVASAVFALDQIKRVLKKIDVFCEKEKKEGIKEGITRIVIKQGLSIRAASNIIEKPQKEEIRIVKDAIERDVLSRQRFVSLYERLIEKGEESDRLRSRIREQKAMIRNYEKEISWLKKRPDKENKQGKERDIIKQKDARIAVVESGFKKAQNDISNLKKEIKRISSAVVRKKVIAVKRLKDLSTKEIEEKDPVLGISPEDIIFVDNPNIFSNSSIARVKGSMIIYVEKPGKALSLKDITFIDHKSLGAHFFKYFVLLDPGLLEKELAKKDLISSVVLRYKKEREKFT